MLPPSVPAGSSPARLTRKELLAKQLLAKGEPLLFLAPSHAGLVTAALLGGAFWLFSAYLLWLNGIWEGKDGVPWLVAIANRIGMVFMVSFGGYMVLRAAKHIKSIRIIPWGDSVRLLVKVRRIVPLPFVPQKEIVAKTSEFKLPSRMVAQMEMPKWADAEVADIKGNLAQRILKRASMSSFNFFTGMRKVFTHEGFMDVNIDGSYGLWKLDTAGKFANGGKNLFDIVEYET